MICSTCRQETDRFPPRRKQCYPCRRATETRGRPERERKFRERTQARINAIKEASPCTDCGEFYPAICMDFDHVNDDKEFNVGDLVGQRASWEKVQAEMDKCELVCANCHRLRTRDRILQRLAR